MKKKIVLVIGELRHGGAERITVYLANYLSAKGRCVYVISTFQGEVAYNLNEKIHYIVLDRKIQDNNFFIRFLTLLKCLRKELKQINPDLVLGMMMYNGLAASLALIDKKIPVVTSERVNPASATNRKWLEKILILLMLFIKIKGVIFQTHEAQNYYPKLIQKKSIIIPNPLLVKEFPICSSRRGTYKRLISVGRLEPQKNHRLLINAFESVFKIFPEYTLYIYGEGSKRVDLEKQIREKGLENNVFLPGNIANVFDELNKSDVFLLTSNYEGMPNALIEAMAMGLPVISTKCEGGGAEFLIDHNVNGLLVPIDSQEELEEALFKLINDVELCKKLGAEAIKIRKTLDGEYICKQWMNYLDKVI